MQLGTYLKHVRNYFGMTQSEIAESLGISQCYYSEIERNKKRPHSIVELVQEKYPMKDGLALYLTEVGANKNKT